MVHDTKTASEVRTNFSSFVAQVVENPYVRVFFGSYRKPEAVLMSSRADLPDEVLTHLLVATACNEAKMIIREHRPKNSYPRIGDNAGKILAWLWRLDPDRATEFLTDIVAELRHHHPGAPKPRIKVSEFLEVIDGALPHGFPPAELAALRRKAAIDIPIRLGEDGETP